MKSFSFTKKTEGNKAFLFIAKLKVIPGKSSVLLYKKSKQKENRTEGNKGTHIKAAPYLAGVLGVPEHPRNLGVHKRGEA